MKHIIYILRWLLLPFSWLYGGITRLRNWCYNRRLLKAYDPPVPTIVVGNLTVGGTGKTPHVEYLIRLFRDKASIVTLSRGYGRKTKGFRWADITSTAQEIGDEPLQFFQKFHPSIYVAVGEDRAAAIKRILAEKPATSLILLDDAFQHRAVNPTFSIVLTDYKRLFYKDFLLPTGYLRESRAGVRRAHCVIVSKCPPDLSIPESEQIRTQITRYATSPLAVFFTSIRYGMPRWFSGVQVPFVPENPVLLVSGIAQPEVLEAYVQSNYRLQQHLIFPDHYAYTQTSLEKILDACHNLQITQILTTEKDFVKLHKLPFSAEVTFFYVPIEMYFLFDKETQFATLFSF